MEHKKAIILALVIVPLVIAAIGGGGYMAWNSLQAQHDENTAILQKFGFEIMPANPYTESEGVLGQKQLPATFAEDSLSPVEKVIHGLMKDKEHLIHENETLQQQIDELQTQVSELEHYKKVNEQFAPETLEQELSRTRQEIETALRALPEAQRFSEFWINMMAGAALTEYERFINANRMMVDGAIREQMVQHDLLNYAFCVGNAVEIAANTAEEVRLIARWLEQPGAIRLPNALRDDLNMVLPPCQAPLRADLSADLNIGGE